MCINGIYLSLELTYLLYIKFEAKIKKPNGFLLTSSNINTPFPQIFLARVFLYLSQMQVHILPQTYTTDYIKEIILLKIIYPEIHSCINIGFLIKFK